MNSITSDESKTDMQSTLVNYIVMYTHHSSADIKYLLNIVFKTMFSVSLC